MFPAGFTDEQVTESILYSHSIALIVNGRQYKQMTCKRKETKTQK